MKTFEIEIKETLSRVVEIESESIEEATTMAKEKYDNEEIVLDYSDHKTTDIDISGLEGLEDNEEFLNFVLSNTEKMISKLSVEDLAIIGFGSLLDAKAEYEKTK